MHYAILGNGVAGMEAALELRRRDPRARISVVSDEHDHFFSRPALMYVFCGQLDLRGTEPYDRGHYERMRFERVRGHVTSLDPAGHVLRFQEGRELAYDRLLVAAGSRARTGPWPGTEGPGVHAFVTLQDLQALDGDARPGQRAVVIGGGLIGVEVAEVLRRRGLEVAFVIRESWYFPLALDAQESQVVAEHMRAHGCDVRLRAGVAEIVRGADGRVRAVRLEGGDELPCDVAVVAIGVVPNTGFLASSGLRLAPGGAIEVDEALRASAPDVWAAGDCANVTWHDGSRRPEQLWYTARDQGRVAARSMAGEPAAYRRGTWYNSAKFFDLEWTTAGFVPAEVEWDAGGDGAARGGGRSTHRSWFQRVPGRPVCQRIALDGERVIGFNLLGSRWDHERLLGWVEERRDLSWVLAHLHEAQFDEELSEPFRVLPDARVS